MNKCSIPNIPDYLDFLISKNQSPLSASATAKAPPGPSIGLKITNHITIVPTTAADLTKYFFTA